MKKIFAVILVIVAIAVCCVTASAECFTENDRPTGMIGFELFKRLCDDYEDADAEEACESNVEIRVNVIKTKNGETMVLLASEDQLTGAEYFSIGAYDHDITIEDIANVYSNRISEDEFDNLYDSYVY